MDGFTIPIPEKRETGRTMDGWERTTEIPCACGGLIHWGDNGYSPGCRVCDRCL